MISWERAVHLQAPRVSVALGGGARGRFLVHVFIWHQIWRAAPTPWRIPTGRIFCAGLAVPGVLAGRPWPDKAT